VKRVQLNLCGEVCPYTFVRAKLALEELDIDDEMEILLDHRPARISLPRALREEGHEVLAVGPLAEEGASGGDGHGRFVIAVRKRPPVSADLIDFGSS